MTSCFILLWRRYKFRVSSCLDRLCYGSERQKNSTETCGGAVHHTPLPTVICEQLLSTQTAETSQLFVVKMNKKMDALYLQKTGYCQYWWGQWWRLLNYFCCCCCCSGVIACRFWENSNLSMHSIFQVQKESPLWLHQCTQYSNIEVPWWVADEQIHSSERSKGKGKGFSHMSRDGFYGIDQSATSAQGPEYTIRARPWMESVPGPLKRGQEKCSCPLLSGPGTNQERLFARFFFLETARPSFELAFYPITATRIYSEKERQRFLTTKSLTRLTRP